MKKNIGTPGRIIRFAIALILLFLAYQRQSWILLGFGLFTLYESLASWCVVYALLGINSCPINNKK